MFSISWISSAFFIATVVFCSARTTERDPSNLSTNIWAVLVAGSHKWVRYRHQSNVCHAYQMLRGNGIPEDRIITFMYDDIAYNSENPEPGVIRNEPNGKNVYKDVAIDYRGEDVSKAVFLDVLQGHKQKVKGIGSERVVSSTNKDNILIFHTGLGGEDGFIEFPDSGPDSELYADELVAVFKSLHNSKSYKNLLIYLESSHSGAMFCNSTLPHNISAMAITAGGTDEDTWGTFCDTNIQPCLAGLFSYAWMNYAENNPDELKRHQKIFDHYDHVRDVVTNTGKEHPQLYGDWNVGKLPISQFIGYKRSQTQPGSKPETKFVGDENRAAAFDKDAIISRAMTVESGGRVRVERKTMPEILNNLVELVFPDEHVRNTFLKNEPIHAVSRNQCLDHLSSLFDEKCVALLQKDDHQKYRQEKFDVFAKLCDVAVADIRHMTAAEAIAKTCA